jgi:hypothetical protein
MSVGPISPANGADVLYNQSVVQRDSAAVAASVNALETAIAQAKQSESEELAGSNQVNVYA